MRKHLVIAASLAAAISFGASGANAAGKSPAEFYKDNVVTIILGAGPGGGYDLYARTVMSHLVKHIPGKPSYILQFMPGAGGQKAAGYVYNVAPKDGLKMAKLSNMLPAFQLLRGKAKYDVSKMNYIGRAASMQYVTMVWHTTGVKNLARHTRHKLHDRADKKTDRHHESNQKANTGMAIDILHAAPDIDE